MVDFTKYRTKDFLQILKGNEEYKVAIATKDNWEDVVKVIDSLDVIYTNEQLEYVKQTQWL